MTIGNEADHLRMIRKVADYQFGKGAGERLFPDDVKITVSKKTGRVRHILHGDELIAALNPNSGLLILSIEGARRLARGDNAGFRWVKVQDGVASFIEDGGDVFAKHVVEADDEIRPMDEVIIFNSKGDVIAVGKAVLSGAEMLEFN